MQLLSDSWTILPRPILYKSSANNEIELSSEFLLERNSMVDMIHVYYYYACVRQSLFNPNALISLESFSV